MKIISRIFIILIIIVALGLFFRNVIAKAALTKAVEQATGLKLEVDAVNIGLLKTSLSLEGLKLYNPADFEDKIMIDLPEFFVDYSLKALLEKEVHIPHIRLNLQKLLIAKNAKGTYNLQSLQPKKSSQTLPEGKKPPSESKKGEKSPASQVKVDVLDLAIGKIIYKDYSKDPVSVREINLNVNERIENVSEISDLNALLNLIIDKALAKANILDLIDINGIQGKVAKSIEQAQEKMAEVVEEGKAQIEETKQEVQEQAQEKIEEVKEEAEKTVEDLKDKFKSGFSE